MPLLEVKDLSMHYSTTKGDVRAVDDVSFSLERGEALGLVGESGCGKTSIAISLLKLLPDNGRIVKGHAFFKVAEPAAVLSSSQNEEKMTELIRSLRAAQDRFIQVRLAGKKDKDEEPLVGYLRGVSKEERIISIEKENLSRNGKRQGQIDKLYLDLDQVTDLSLDLVSLSEDEIRGFRWKGISMVFQAAMNSLNPVYKVGDQIVEAILTHERVSEEAARARVVELFKLVGLDADRMDHYPHEYSGGMKQRAIIAMALSCNPEIIIADEPTTALDVIVQDKILKEMNEIRKKLNMSMIYISHDIAVIAEVSDWMGVMYAGKLVEFADTVTIFKKPSHPYTHALMNAFPSLRGEKRELQTLAGEPPDLLNPPTGCRFHPRCPYATETCEKEEPPFEHIGEGHWRACWHPLN